MNLPITIETYSGNKYFHNPYLKKLFLCHPLIYYMLTLKLSGVDIGVWVKNLKKKSINIENVGNFTYKDVKYYYRKFLLFENSEYFKDIDTSEMISGRLYADMVESLLVNTPRILFEVTESCNLKCDYCAFGKFYTNKYEERKEKCLEYDTAISLLKYIFNSSLKKTEKTRLDISFYGGEPLLNFSFIKRVVNYINIHYRHLQDINYSMTTNGIYLDRYIDFLYRNNFQILISLDGNKKNNAYRVFNNGLPVFDKIIKNITYIKKKYPVYFEKNINFNAVLHDKNSLQEIYTFFKNKYNKLPTLSELNTNGINLLLKEEFYKKFNSVMQSFDEINNCAELNDDLFTENPHFKRLNNMLCNSSRYYFRDYLDLLYNQRKAGIPTGTCLPFSRKLMLTVDGTILPCEQISYKQSFHCMNENKVEIDFEKIAQAYNVHYDNLFDKCKLCYRVFNCKLCILLANNSLDNDICEEYADYTNYSQYLKNNLSLIEDSPDLYRKINEETANA